LYARSKAWVSKGDTHKNVLTPNRILVIQSPGW
jgi:hypothetical protein